MSKTRISCVTSIILETPEKFKDPVKLPAVKENSLLFSDTYGPRALLAIARLKNGNFLMYHADGPGNFTAQDDIPQFPSGKHPYVDFCERVKKEGEKVFLLQKKEESSHHDKTVPVLFDNLQKSINSGDPKIDISIEPVHDYKRVVCSGNEIWATMNLNLVVKEGEVSITNPNGECFEEITLNVPGAKKNEHDEVVLPDDLKPLDPGKVASGNVVFSSEYTGPRMAIVARLKDNKFVQYSAYQIGATPAYDEFCQHVKKENADIFIFQKITGPESVVDKQKQMARLLAQHLYNEGLSHIHIVRTFEYHAVVCDAKSGRVFLTRQIKFNPASEKEAFAVSPGEKNTQPVSEELFKPGIDSEMKEVRPQSRKRIHEARQGAHQIKAAIGRPSSPSQVSLSPLKRTGSSSFLNNLFHRGNDSSGGGADVPQSPKQAHEAKQDTHQAQTTPGSRPSSPRQVPPSPSKRTGSIGNFFATLLLGNDGSKGGVDVTQKNTRPGSQGY